MHICRLEFIVAALALLMSQSRGGLLAATGGAGVVILLRRSLPHEIRPRLLPNGYSARLLTAAILLTLVAGLAVVGRLDSTEGIGQ